MLQPRRHATPRPHETILVIDDDPTLLGLVAQSLQGCGYQTLTACDAETGWDALHDERVHIHLLLTDIVLPGISGCALARKVQPLRPDLRVLYMSGYSENPGTVDDFPAPGSEFLLKPFPPEQLLRSVRQALDRPQRVMTAAS